MKRSEINVIMRRADAFLREHRFHLPPFAYWTPEEWAEKGPEVAEIVECPLQTAYSRLKAAQKILQEAIADRRRRGEPWP